MNVTHIRLERPSTGSWLTFKLPYPMTFEEGSVYAVRQLQGWQAVSASLGAPKVEE